MKHHANRPVSAPHPRQPYFSPVVIRLATAGDRRGLERLAQLDSTFLPAGEIMIGELHGRPVVAVGMADGTVVADPFMPTTEIAELVSLRAQQLGPVTHIEPTRGERPRSKASRVRSKRVAPQIGSVLPMYHRVSQLILRTT
jgi:hypothetical protein